MELVQELVGFITRTDEYYVHVYLMGNRNREYFTQVLRTKLPEAERDKLHPGRPIKWLLEWDSKTDKVRSHFELAPCAPAQSPPQAQACALPKNR